MAVIVPAPDTIEMSFSCPKIGPKVYITTGPSGSPETFKRALVDAELVAFVKQQSEATIQQLVDHFISQREISEDGEPTRWFTIVGYLGRVLGVSPRAVPFTAGIAFWGQVVIAALARNAN